MLEKMPEPLGHALRDARAGMDKLVFNRCGMRLGHGALQVASLAFADHAPIPARYTADGEGVSPPLSWRDLPAGTAAVALLVEDPDAPAPNPLVHAIVWNIPADVRRLPEGGISPDGKGSMGGDVGRNSLYTEGWLPPDPPTGHGNHDYVFQLFALNEIPPMGPNPGRDELVGALEGRVLAAGLLVGTYSRGEETPVGLAALRPVT